MDGIYQSFERYRFLDFQKIITIDVELDTLRVILAVQEQYEECVKTNTQEEVDYVSKEGYLY
jgi:hypothetical protein